MQKEEIAYKPSSTLGRMATARIRNFSIIAHIDHGKSTLSDSILEAGNALHPRRKAGAQILDSLEIEKERGITVKSAAITFPYQAEDGHIYLFNLIDTPGHVDFTYEVRRSLASCEGALLIVDATQGVQAQTLSNFYLALEAELELIPVINKIDLPSADIGRVQKEIYREFSFTEDQIIAVSAKTGENIHVLLKAIVDRIPSPDKREPPFASPPAGEISTGAGAKLSSSPPPPHTSLPKISQTPTQTPTQTPMQTPLAAPVTPSASSVTTASLNNSSGQSTEISSAPVSALIFDAYYDTYRGVVVCVRIFSGEIFKNENIKMIAANCETSVEELGWLGLERTPRKSLQQGEVGYLILSLRSLSDVHMGDTLVRADDRNPRILAGYREVKSMIFAGLFPIQSDQYNELQTNMEKLSLNDAALVYQADNSAALGFGFRCGFLGLLHMEITQERLSREFASEVIVTAPSVSYRVLRKHRSEVDGWEVVDNPAHFPAAGEIEAIEEPFISATLIFPSTYMGAVLQLVRERRGIQQKLHYINATRVEAVFSIPLGEFVFDFHDQLKSITRGYGSLDYDFEDYHPADIIKVDILVNKEVVDALSFMAHRDHARARAKTILVKLREEIPRQMFKIPLQAAIGSNILAREDIAALRKDVTAKCYGGDITRKRKLLEKQKEGKKKMKSIGRVEIPQKAFLSVLRTK